MSRLRVGIYAFASWNSLDMNELSFLVGWAMDGVSLVVSPWLTCDTSQIASNVSKLHSLSFSACTAAHVISSS